MGRRLEFFLEQSCYRIDKAIKGRAAGEWNLEHVVRTPSDEKSVRENMRGEDEGKLHIRACYLGTVCSSRY